jgi:hypothetical protein
VCIDVLYEDVLSRRRFVCAPSRNIVITLFSITCENF